MTIMIKLKNIAYAMMLSLLFPLSSNADLVDVIDFEANDAGTVHNGFTVSGSLVGNTYTFSFTQTGNLDSGTVDDTLSFDLIYEAYSGSTFSAVTGDVTLGSATTPGTSNRNWFNGFVEAGDTLSLQIANVSYTDGEGDESVVFNGFQAINPTSFADTPAGNMDFYVGLAGATTITGDPTFNADLLAANGTSTSLFFTAASGPVRLRNLDFQFEIVGVPEPSSLMLVGLVLCGLTVRRRRV